MSIVRASGSSRSAGPWTCRRPPTTSARAGQRSAGRIEDERLLGRIQPTCTRRNYDAYGYRRTWKTLLRAGRGRPRADRVQRLMALTASRAPSAAASRECATMPNPDATRSRQISCTATSPPRRPTRVAGGLHLPALLGGNDVLQLRDRRLLAPHASAGSSRPTCARPVLDALAMAVTRQPAAPTAQTHPPFRHRHRKAGSTGPRNTSTGRSCDGSAACRLQIEPVGRRCARLVVRRWSAGASAAVLGGDRAGCVHCSRCGGGRRVRSGRRPVVSGGWRHADRHARCAVGTVLVVRRARGDRTAACCWLRGAGGCAPARSVAVDDLAGVAPQRRDPQRQP